MWTVVYLLKAAIVDQDDVVEQFAFSQLEIGGEIDVDSLNPELMGSARLENC